MQPGNKETLADILQLHWPFLKDVLKEQYLVLTDDDLLLYSAGREDEFFEHLERKTCRPREEFEKLIFSCELPAA